MKKKKKISFLIPLAFSFRAVNTVLWKVNIDQHDTSVEQKQNLSPWLDRTHDLSNAGRAPYILSYENSWRARSFNWVRCSGGHGSDSCRGLRFCLCSTFVSCWSINPSHFVAELKIHHLFSLINTILSQFSPDDLLRKRNGASCWLPKVRLTLTASTLGQL